MKESLTEKTVLLALKNNFRYEGVCVHEDDIFLHLDDFKTGRLIILSKSELRSIEVMK